MISREIHYKVRWRAGGNYPGHHASDQKGGGLYFRHHVPLINAPDPRRFDVRASLRDPFGQIQVRVYQQTSAIPVYLIADLSASMDYRGAHSKRSVLADFIACLSYSVSRTGDSFGYIGCGGAGSVPQLLPLSASRAAGFEAAQKLRDQPLQGRDSEGLLGAADLLGGRRALVFLLSDFHFPTALLERVLASLAVHDVVPVMLWDRYEYEDLPNFGLVRVADAESGRDRLLFMRPDLKRRIRQTFATRRAALFSLFSEFGRAPLVLLDGFSADEVTRYFIE